MFKRSILIFLEVLLLLSICIYSIAEDEQNGYESLNGRGRSDSGRSEPQYVGHSGYLAFYGTFSGDDDSCLEAPWEIPTFLQDKQFWNEVGTVEHKTEVRVLWQELTHEGWGNYSGILLVERIDNGEQLYVDVSNFITKPYWTFSELREAALVGEYLAEFHQKSNYYPVDRSNEKVQIKEGAIVLVNGVTGTYGRNGPNKNTHPIEALVFQKWKYGYGGVSVFFAEEDLEIIY